MTESQRGERVDAPRDVGLDGVVLLELPEHRDVRGALVVAELDELLPFRPRRFFMVHDVPRGRERGGHVHRSLRQHLVTVAGQVSVEVDDGRRQRTWRLKSPREALFVPPWIWSVQRDFSPDAVLLVLASESHDEAELVRDYEAFRRLVGATPKGLRRPAGC